MNVLRCFLFGLLAASLIAAHAASPNPDLSAKRTSLPLAFEPNVGQTDPRVRFLARGAGATLFLTGPEAVLSLRGGAVLRMRLEGAGAGTAEALEPLPGVTHYYTGNDPARWHTNVPHSGRVRFAGVYPGIDAVWYGRQGNPEVDFVVAPGADPAAIGISFQGADRLEISPSGDLLIHLASRSLTLQRPVSYQEIEGVRREVKSRFRLQGGRVGFELAAYDATRPLVIDPVLTLSSYLGGDATDDVAGVAVSAGGDLYATGLTESSDFPGADAAAEPEGAVYVTRIAGDRRSIVFTTILDGRSRERGLAIAVDDLRAAYVTGNTTSRDFPLRLPFESNLNPGLSSPFVEEDAFLTKLSASGSIVFSTYLGGRDEDSGNAIAVDADHRPYVAGSTRSNNFPLKNEIQDAGRFEESSAFLTVFAADGQSLAYSTQLGGESLDSAEALAVDRIGNAYLAGDTFSKNFPIKSFLQSELAGTRDAWVAKVNPASSGVASLVYSTYLGGAGFEQDLAIAVDAAGQAHVTGVTDSKSFPLVAPPGREVLDRTQRGTEAFITKLNARGNGLLFSTFFGGSGFDFGNAIAVDSGGAVYVAGTTDSLDLQVVNPFQATLGGESDAFVAKIDPFTSTLLWSSYLGGLDTDLAFAVALDPRANVYVGGLTFSGATFPQVAPFQDAFGGGDRDGFLVRLAATSPDTIGVFRAVQSKMILCNSNTVGSADFTMTLGQPGDLPVAGDWFGFGARPGIFRAGTFILKRFNNDLLCCNLTFNFGQDGDQPIAGDWNGDGIDTVGVFTSTGEFQLINSNAFGEPELAFLFGNVGDVPLAGDWNGDGIDTIGVFRPSTGEFFLRNTNDTGPADITVAGFAQPGDLPVAGDWDGDGITTIGVRQGDTYLLRNSNSSGPADFTLAFGVATDLPVVGDWDGRP
ncbi:MAG TPA: SBBP repeat-containing protein [Thermoanaerobaculia bacterium]|jgi:hypothetical protein|nr:SBBP repeat-containing protein [Thermoanaerobaculia bacterium]